jgi:recombination DNA repair RAD52 pathway protein
MIPPIRQPGLKPNPSLKQNGGFLDIEKIREKYVSHEAEPKEACPEALRPALLPFLRVIEEPTLDIELYEKMVAKKAETEYPETRAIRTIHGVGPLMPWLSCWF